MYRVSARFNFNDDVPGYQDLILLSVMNHIFFIAGGERLVYRDSILSRIIFFIAGGKRLVYRDSNLS